MHHFLRQLTFRIWYYFSPPWDTGVSPPELFAFIDQQPPGKAIDIGCGTGTNVITLAQAGWRVTGVDFVPRAIEVAKRKAKKAGVQAEFLVRDATNLKGISGSFDLALDIGCFHSLGNQKAAYLSELERILAPGRYWLMYGFFKPALEQSKEGATQSGPGLGDADLELIATSMKLIWRQDGFEKGERPSAWFLYQKAPDLNKDQNTDQVQ
jgi:ubiquinone/menaquinone biosynthesis C-methylase UbiE